MLEYLCNMYINIPAVNDIEEQPGASFVENTVSYLNDDQAGWFHKTNDNGSFMTKLDRIEQTLI